MMNKDLFTSLQNSGLQQLDVCCAIHGEPFRQCSGFDKFAVMIVQEIVDRNLDGVPSKTKIQELAKDSKEAFCCLLPPEILEICYMSSRSFDRLECYQCGLTYEGVAFSKASLCLKCLCLKRR